MCESSLISMDWGWGCRETSGRPSLTAAWNISWSQCGYWTLDLAFSCKVSCNFTWSSPFTGLPRSFGLSLLWPSPCSDCPIRQLQKTHWSLLVAWLKKTTNDIHPASNWPSALPIYCEQTCRILNGVQFHVLELVTKNLSFSTNVKVSELDRKVMCGEGARKYSSRTSRVMDQGQTVLIFASDEEHCVMQERDFVLVRATE